MRQGTVVDATIIAAPSSAKNEEGERDPEMRQAKKGNQWHFGMRRHSGVDAESGLIHTVVCTAVHEADVVHAHELLHGQESKAAQDEGRLCQDIGWRIAMKRGRLQAMPQGPAKALYEWFERLEPQVQAVVEHAFHIIKNPFGDRKVSYRGIAKNEARAKAHAALANLYIAGRTLMAHGISASEA